MLAFYDNFRLYNIQVIHFQNKSNKKTTNLTEYIFQKRTQLGKISIYFGCLFDLGLQAL